MCVCVILSQFWELTKIDAKVLGMVKRVAWVAVGGCGQVLVKLVKSWVVGWLGDSHSKM